MSSVAESSRLRRALFAVLVGKSFIARWLGEQWKRRFGVGRQTEGRPPRPPPLHWLSYGVAGAAALSVRLRVALLQASWFDAELSIETEPAVSVCCPLPAVTV